METIIKSGFEKIMKLFYLDKEAKLHLREIARRTKLNINSATRFLNKLEKMEIVKAKREGNLKKFSALKNDKTYWIFSLFDLERFNGLPEIRKRAIYLFSRKLETQPIISVLFGSTAKGTFNKQSDIDLLLIVNKKINVEHSKEEVNSQTGLNINAFQIEYKEFLKEIREKKDNLIQSALTTGFPITNHDFYYGVLEDG